MYAGHFAAGLAIKAREPRAPTWAVLVGVGLLDLLFGPFVVLGIERVAVTPDISPGFELLHIDWSHSLLMAVVWSVLFAWAFRGRGRAVAGVLGLAVFSHFLLDLPMHPRDLALWPGSDVHLGLGLWRIVPQGWWFVELAFIAACGAYYRLGARRDPSFGRYAGWALGVVVTLHLFNSPWLSTL